MNYKTIEPHVLTKNFSSGTKVEYLCKECGVLCKKQATSLYYQTRDRIATNDRRLYWCIECTKKSPEFLNKVSENAIASNKALETLGYKIKKFIDPKPWSINNRNRSRITEKQANDESNKPKVFWDCGYALMTR